MGGGEASVRAGRLGAPRTEMEGGAGHTGRGVQGARERESGVSMY